jgi:hypothetical protein
MHQVMQQSCQVWYLKVSNAAWQGAVRDILTALNYTLSEDADTPCCISDQELDRPSLVLERDIRIPMAVTDFLAALAHYQPPITAAHTWLMPQTRLWWVKAEHISLTEKEYILIECLLKADGHTIDKGILSHALGWASDTDSHHLESHLWRLRQKCKGYGVDIGQEEGQVQLIPLSDTPPSTRL